MKICYLTNIRFPSERANATQVVQMCRSFANLGNDVDLIVNTRPTHITQSPEEFYGFTFNFKYFRVYVPDIAKYGKWFFGIATIFFCINVLSIIKRKKYDVLYCRNEWILAFLELWFPKQLKIYESHEAKFSMPVRFLIRRGVKIVVISEGIKNAYIHKGVPEKQMLVAHDGIDESFFRTETQTVQNTKEILGIPEGRPIAMYIGGLDVWKGVETFFKAFNILNHVQGVVIGGRPDVVKELKQKYPTILFLGERPYRELPYNQKVADVLVVPNTATVSLSSQYTSPLKLFAHLASGVPLVVSDIPSMKNVVTSEYVYFAKADNPNSFAEMITLALENKKLSQQKAIKALELAHNYTWNKRAKHTLTFISGT